MGGWAVLLKFLETIIVVLLWLFIITSILLFPLTIWWRLGILAGVMIGVPLANMWLERRREA